VKTTFLKFSGSGLAMECLASKLVSSPMKLWPFSFLFLLLSQPSLLGQEAAANTNVKKGMAALADGLWEIAEQNFRQRLAEQKLTAEEKSEATVRLAESLIRAGNSDEALSLLSQSSVAKKPETLFWKAQALAGKNRFKEAVEIFTTLLADPTAAHRTEAGFTQTSLLLALEQPDAALGALKQLADGANAATRTKIKLYQTEILLDQNRTAEAREAMPKKDSITDSTRPLANFLEAQLLVRENKPADAEVLFQALVNQPQGQSILRFHYAAIGLADTIYAQGKSDASIQSLLTFLQDYPDSPTLEALFKRLIDWLPEKPAATDPILEQLAKWISPPALSPVDVIFNSASTANGSEATSAWPSNRVEETPKDISLFSLYARGIGLHRLENTKSKAEGKRLLQRLLIENPEHILASRALYQLADWSLDAGDSEQAFSTLDSLRETTRLTNLKGEAAFIEARAAYLNNDPKAAIQLFDEAASALAEPAARAAKLQAAIARIRSGDLKGVTLIQQSDTTPNKELEAELALERALSKTPLNAAKPEIDDFLARFPDHPRAAEARLAAVEIALTSPEANLETIPTQLDILFAAAEEFPAFGPRVALANLRFVDRLKDTAATIAAAQKLMETYPEDPVAAEAALTLGRTLFQSGSYNPARLVLEKLAAADTNPVRAQSAWLLAARSAALGGTPKSKEEALILFDKTIESGGPLSAVATLEKASHLINMSRLPDASAFLEKWIKTLPENDPLQLPAGLLLGEALYAQGSSHPASLTEALAVYDKLLTHAKTYPALFNRLQYLRGITLEQLPDEKDPQKKREKQAFQAFYSVLETTSAPAEWEYFERCGFRALAILEKEERWPVAITVAKKIAAFNGPRAEEAATRASALQLKHMIFEE
jgi:TolA-binding protein